MASKLSVIFTELISPILRGAFNQLPREQIETPRDFPREQIHHATPSAFQQIVPDTDLGIIYSKTGLDDATSNRFVRTINIGTTKIQQDWIKTNKQMNVK